MSCMYHSKIATNVSFSKFPRKSPIWHSIRKLWLTINMRALTDSWFSGFLLQISDGVEETTDESFICIPDDMFIVTHVFPAKHYYDDVIVRVNNYNLCNEEELFEYYVIYV
uniref:Uncharacterized protein n=1 Tax=Lactuca sativa TaxID=4236 RepID=A0A9R1WCL3_LACSA|nr:hypothetical protein LSAT_V11C200076280 [Lactuca sativa]